MRHLPALAASLLLLSASQLSEARPFRPIDPGICPKPITAPDKAQFKRLTDLPPANAYQAVLRSDHRGCLQAIPVRQHIGRSR